MSYEIFDDIPIPKGSARGSTAKYPAATLAVGQNYFVSPKADEDINKCLKRAVGAAQRARAGNKDLKFTGRIDNHPHTGEQVVGIWRVK